MKVHPSAKCAMLVVGLLCLGCRKTGPGRREAPEAKPADTEARAPAETPQKPRATSGGEQRARTLDEFVKALREGGITIKQMSPLPGGRFPGSTKGCYLYLDSLGEWIEVYEFASPGDAAKAFPDNLYSVTINENKIETKVEIKGALALFVYDQHSQWPEVYAVWQGF